MSFLRVKDHVSLFVPSFISMFILKKFSFREDNLQIMALSCFRNQIMAPSCFLKQITALSCLLKQIMALYCFLNHHPSSSKMALQWGKAIRPPNNSDLCPAKCKQGDFLHIWYFVIIIKFVCFPMITIIHHQSSHTSVYKKKLNIYCDCTFIRGVKQHNEKL